MSWVFSLFFFSFRFLIALDKNHFIYRFFPLVQGQLTEYCQPFSRTFLICTKKVINYDWLFFCLARIKPSQWNLKFILKTIDFFPMIHVRQKEWNIIDLSWQFICLKMRVCAWGNASTTTSSSVCLIHICELNLRPPGCVCALFLFSNVFNFWSWTPG